MACNLIYFKIFNRFYYSSSVRYAAIHKTFRKIMSANSGKKRKFTFEDNPVLRDSSKLGLCTPDGKPNPSTTSKRASMLNKMFMRYITDLMINSESWEQYAKFGIELSRVQVSSDFKSLNIYWVNKETDMDEEIENFLASDAFTLRHQLSRLCLMGNVPPIFFVKDKRRSQIADLDARMAIADYGEDYEPTAVTRLKHQLELYSPLEEKVKAQLEKLDNELDEEYVETDLPEMPQNVLGLDHATILSRIQNLKKKSESRPEILSNRVEVENYGDVETDNLSSGAAFRAFLKKRQLINQKLYKKDKNYNPDLEYIKQELEEYSTIDHYEKIGNNLDRFDEDFIEEVSDEDYKIK